MAEDRVDVPIDLTVENIKTGDIDLKDVEQKLSKRVSGIVKSIEGIMGNVDSSKFNKALESSFSAMEKSYDKVQTANARYNDAMRKAGESSEEYKAKLSEVKSEMKAVQDSWNTYNDFMGQSYAGAKEAEASGNLKPHQASLIKMYEEELAKYEQQMQAVQAKMPKPEDYVSTGSETALTNLVQKYKELLKAITATDTAQKKWNQSLADNQMSDEYTKKLNELSMYEKKLETVKAKAQKMSELGATSQSWKSLHYDADLLEEKIRQIVKEMQNMIKTGSAFRFGEGDSAGQLDMLSDRLDNVSSSMSKLRSEPDNVKKNVMGLVKVINTFCNSAKKGLANVISMFKKLGKTSSNTGKQVNKSLKKLWKNILMFGLGVRSTYFLVKRLRNTFIESFKEMATQIPEVNTSISSFMTSVNQLKGSLATAFQPIVSAIIPWLNQLIAALNNAMNALARFFATLTGQGYIYKFTANQVDYAESLDKTAGSAKKAQKSLMGFDEINRLNDDSDSGSGGDTPTGTWEKEMLNGMSTLAELIKEAWKDGDFYEVGQYIGEKLLGALKVADEWIVTKGYGLADKIGNSLATLLNGIIETKDLGNQIGKTIADALNMGLIGIDKFLSTTNWLSLGQFIADWANASVSNFKWDLLGKTVADLIKAGVDTWWKFVGEFDFSALGNKVATAINNMFSNILSADETGLNVAEKLGQSITKTVRGILTTLTDAINNTDWSAVGKTIGEVLGNIDWSGIAWDFTKLVAAVVKALGEAFLNWAATDPLSAGLAAMLGLALGAIDLGAKVTGLILKFAPLIKDADDLAKIFKTVLDIVKKWAPTFGGIITVVTGVITFFTNFFDMLKNGFSWVNEALMALGAALTAIGVTLLTGISIVTTGGIALIVAALATIVILVKDNWTEICAFVKAIPGWLMDNIVTPVVNFFKQLGADIVTFFKNAWTDIQNAWKSVSNWFKTEIITPVVNFFKTLGTDIVNAFKTALTNIQNTWKAVTSWFNSNVITPVKNAFQNALNNIKGFFTSCWNGIKSAWGSAKTWFTNIANGVKTAFNNAVSGVKSAFSGLWTAVKNGCKTAFNSVIGFIEKGINGLINGINKAINGINKIAGGAAKLAGINFTGISNIPTVSLPRLAQGGVIPPNNEFMAILGDQKHGTNIEAPLDTIKQAVAEELAEYIDAMMTGFQAVVDAVNDKDFDVTIGDTIIGKAAERYSKRQALVRGTT